MTTLRQLIDELRREGDPAADEIEKVITVNQAFASAEMADRDEVERFTSPTRDGSWDATIADL